MAKFAVALCILLAAYEAQGSATSDLNAHIKNQISYFKDAIAALEQPTSDNYETGTSNIHTYELDLDNAGAQEVEKFNKRVEDAAAASDADASACVKHATTEFKITSEVEVWVAKALCSGELLGEFIRQYQTIRISISKSRTELDTIDGSRNTCATIPNAQDCLKTTAESFCQVNSNLIQLLSSISNLNESYLTHDELVVDCDFASAVKTLGDRADQHFAAFQQCVAESQ